MDLFDETQVHNSNIAQKSEKSRKFLKMRLASPHPRFSLVKKDLYLLLLRGSVSEFPADFLPQLYQKSRHGFLTPSLALSHFTQAVHT